MNEDLASDRRSLLKACLWAAGAAVVALVVGVLPAEYGIDPTGIGKLTGLTRFSASKLDALAPKGEASANAAPVAAAGVTGTAAPLAVWSVSHAERFKQRSYEIPLKGDEEFEYKALIARGDGLLYNWRVKEGSQVYFEFHGEPTEGTWPKDYYESYEKGESTGGAGSMVSPFTGHHGWYWLNLSEKPVTLLVELAGYYSQFGKYGEPPIDDAAPPVKAPPVKEARATNSGSVAKPGSAK
jgi:hypothetical protein